ncbi:MAG: hypothetical protein KF824_00140 [Fimbriimonadaceae bacterium]|nr:MAG: hypothetical protein KF824_00140 [Fimbriimonadaceae bacterium]
MVGRLLKLTPLFFATAVPLISQASGDGFALYADRVPTAAEAAKNYTNAKFEPRIGCYAGAFIDLDSTILETFQDKTGKVRRMPWAFESVVGKEHATYFYYMGYGSRPAFDWVSKLGDSNKIVHIALEPNNGLDPIKEDQYLLDFAKGLGETKTKIFLRFASEMNGPWVNYHGSPSKYIEKFRLVANVMKRFAPNVAMVWCPYATPTSPIPNYYPGDEYVDWVGVNIYSVTYYDQDPKKPASRVHPVQLLDYIYSRYAKKKPIMVGEYGATHFSALENKPTTDFAKRSIIAMYESLPRAYPRVKCINYFNANNLELAHRKNNNYAVTQNAEVLNLYRSLISQPYFLSAATDSNGYIDQSAVITPVSGDQVTTLFPVQPLPVMQKQKLSGVVKLSGWIEDLSGSVKMRFMVNGKTVHIGESKDDWSYPLDTVEYQNGQLKLELRAEKSGKVLKKYPITVTIAN